MKRENMRQQISHIVNEIEEEENKGKKILLKKNSRIMWGSQTKLPRAMNTKDEYFCYVPMQLWPGRLSRKL